MSDALNLLQMQKGTKSFGNRFLFQDVHFAINENEHVGVIGPNGAGKTTLFKILIDQEHLDSGSITRSRQLQVGYLSQHDLWNPDETGNQYLERTTKIPIWELKSQGRKLQVTEKILDQPIMSLSGGYRMRIKLMSLLGSSPNLMMLDEPTNYLDLETTLLLEKFLQSYEGAFLLISHDREFLKRTTDHILEVEQGEVTKYNGNIDDYFEQKQLLREQLESQASRLEDKRKTILDFVARFGAKATKAKQAQSRLKSLSRMESIEIKPLPISATIKIPSPQKTGKIVLSIQDADLGYKSDQGTKTILKDVNVSVNRGDHVAVVGLNGAGKSTLLKALSGNLDLIKGKRELGMDVRIAFFNQHVVEELDPRDSVLSSLQRVAHPAVLRQEILDMAGSLLFSGPDIDKNISVLSGGEKTRVALGRALLRKSPCLILDEPTNHLDFQTVEALTTSLNKFEGTLILVSHDRGFIQRVATKILEVKHGEVHSYPGTYDEYVWSLEQRLSNENFDDEETPVLKSKNASDTPKKPVVVLSRDQKKEQEKKLRACNKKIEECEAEVAKLEKANADLNQQIIDEPAQSFKLIQVMTDNETRLQHLESQWLALLEEKETLTGQTN